MDTLQQRYQKTIRKELMEKLEVKNTMATPKISKIVVNMGVKDAVADKKNVEKAAVILGVITGQKPRIAKAKKSIAAFKLREGEPIGAFVTLRGERMYNFLEKLNNVVFPRLKDFRGIRRTSFDGRGNYALGFSEYAVFPEIDPSSVEKLQGLEVVITTTAKDNTDGMALLEALGMPFVKEEAK